MKANINFTWHVGCDNIVDLPYGKTIADIKEVTGNGVTGTIYFHDGSEHDFAVHADEIVLANYICDEVDEVTVLAVA